MAQKIDMVDFSGTIQISDKNICNQLETIFVAGNLCLLKGSEGVSGCWTQFKIFSQLEGWGRSLAEEEFLKSEDPVYFAVLAKPLFRYRLQNYVLNIHFGLTFNFESNGCSKF